MINNSISIARTSLSLSADHARLDEPGPEHKAIQTVCFKAIADGNLDDFRKLFDHPAVRVDMVNERGQGLLHVAIQSASDEIAFELLQYLDGVAGLLNHVDHDGYTPLMYAVQRHREDLIRALLNAGSTPNIGLSAQKDAIAAGQLQIDAGQTIASKPQDCVPSALQLAIQGMVNPRASRAERADYAKTAVLLVEARADTADALMRAVHMAQPQAARALIRSHNVNPTDALDLLAKARLANEYSTGVLSFLGADYVPPLVAAAQRGDKSYLWATYSHFSEHQLALRQLAAQGDVGAARLLMDVMDFLRIDPVLEYATETSNTAMAKVTIELGANAMRVLKSLVSAERTAQVKVLINAGVDATQLLIEKSKKGKIAAVKTLLDAGADIAPALKQLVVSQNRTAIGVITEALAMPGNSLDAPPKEPRVGGQRRFELPDACTNLPLMIKRNNITAKTIQQTFSGTDAERVLFYLTREKHLELVRDFVALEPAYGQEAMKLAMYLGDLEVIKTLLAIGVAGESALSYAIHYYGFQDRTLVASMIGLGIDPSGALMQACVAGHHRAVGVLPFFGADKLAAQEIAIEAHNTTAIEVLSLDDDKIGEAVQKIGREKQRAAYDALRALNPISFGSTFGKPV